MKQLYGLLGERLGHSFSPAIHSYIFEKLNIKGHYHLFEIQQQNVKDAIAGLKALEIRGVNVTIPYKVEVMKYLDEISQEAQEIGAVNTLCIENNRAIGYNTDYHGLQMMLEHYEVAIKNKRVVILGSGGVSKAVVQNLKDTGIQEITIVSRDVRGARGKYKDYSVLSYDSLKEVRNHDIIINCTPCGMYPHTQNSLVDQGVISNFQWAIDLIYNPQETLFLKYAKQSGVKGINGLYMLVGQAVKAQELWHKTSISQHIVQDVYEKISYTFSSGIRGKG